MNERKRFYISCGLLVILLLASIGYLKSKRERSASLPTHLENLGGSGSPEFTELHHEASNSAVLHPSKEPTPLVSPNSRQLAEPVFSGDEMSVIDTSTEYVNLPTAGNLFIVTGIVVNKSSQTIDYMRVECMLYDVKGGILDKISLMPGKTIEEQEMKGSTLTQLQNALSLWDAKEIEAFKIMSGASLPFMFIFRKPPRNVANFGLRCIRKSREP